MFVRQLKINSFALESCDSSLLFYLNCPFCGDTSCRVSSCQPAPVQTCDGFIHQHVRTPSGQRSAHHPSLPISPDAPSSLTSSGSASRRRCDPFVCAPSQICVALMSQHALMSLASRPTHAAARERTAGTSSTKHGGCEVEHV